MTEREVLLSEAVYWSKRYDDSNPDVGMGPTIDTLLDDVLRSTKLEVSEKERKNIVLSVSRRLYR